MDTPEKEMSDDEKYQVLIKCFTVLRQDIGFVGNYLQQMAALCTELGKNQQLLFNAHQEQIEGQKKLTTELEGLSRRLDYIIDKLMREHDDR